MSGGERTCHPRDVSLALPTPSVGVLVSMNRAGTPATRAGISSSSP